MTSRFTATLLGALVAAAGTRSGTAHAQVEPHPWRVPALEDAASIALSGPLGQAFDRGLARIGQDPYSVELILADVNFGMDRWFTNFSGDVSGRFLELASLTSTTDTPWPPALNPVKEQILQYQKADGHFGVEVDWSEPIDLGADSGNARMMPILWGNGRLLLGLTAAAKRFGDDDLLAAARKLGDFYATVVVDRFCDPQRLQEYRKKAWYAGAYVTCTFQGMEGLVKLYRLTRDRQYLDTAVRMARFHEPFDTLPVDHSHGSISAHEALLLLYEDTGDERLLERVLERWDAAVTGGYVNPCGGVLEMFRVNGCHRDEGCSEADWLRLNLMLWRLTGQTRFLDMAERLLWNAYPANQWPSGGFGHRILGVDETGPFAFHNLHQEALWCCSFHGPLALHELKAYLAVGTDTGVLLNFPLDFQTTVTAMDREWTVTSRALPEQPSTPVRCTVALAADAAADPIRLRIRVPDWASQVRVTGTDGQEVGTETNGNRLVTPPLPPGTTLEIAYTAEVRLEDRRLRVLAIPEQRPAVLDKVVLRYGPHVLMNPDSGEIQELRLQVDADGRVLLPDTESDSSPRPWTRLAHPEVNHAFVFRVRLE
jgi:DUF1680 family protein